MRGNLCAALDKAAVCRGSGSGAAACGGGRQIIMHVVKLHLGSCIRQSDEHEHIRSLNQKEIKSDRVRKKLRERRAAFAAKTG